MKPLLIFLAFAGLPAFAALDGSSAAAPPARDVTMKPLRHNLTPIQPPGEIAPNIDRFFRALQDGDVQGGYEDFLKGSRLLDRKENLAQFVEKTNIALGLYGKVIKYELIDTQTLGSCIVVYTYLSYSSFKPLRWRLVYYRPEKEWKLSNLSFDDSFEDMID